MNSLKLLVYAQGTECSTALLSAQTESGLKKKSLIAAGGFEMVLSNRAEYINVVHMAEYQILPSYSKTVGVQRV